MRLPFQWDADSSPADIQRARLQIADYVRQRGTSQKPLAPRDVRTTGSSRSVLVFWGLPNPSGDISGWRVYKGDEATLYKEISDRGTRQCVVEGTAGTAMNIFVSSVNALGSPDGESPKVQAQGTPTAEAPTVAVASTPADYSSTSGADTSSTLRGVPKPNRGGSNE